MRFLLDSIRTVDPGKAATLVDREVGSTSEGISAPGKLHFKQQWIMVGRVYVAKDAA